VQDAELLWDDVAQHLREHLTDPVWISTFSGVRGLYLDENCLTLAVPNSVVRDRIDSRYRSLVLDSLNEVHPTALAIELRVDSPKVSDDSLQDLHDTNHGEAAAPPAPTPEPRESRERRSGGDTNHSPNVSNGAKQAFPARPTNIKEEYTFDSFVTGSSNRFAQAAALSVAETPARSYNPLFVYGAAGLGKTHLLHAIANYVLDNYPTYRVRYISTETMMNEFIDALRDNQMPEFKLRYRQVDLLLVDDVQFMEEREGLQEEFFHTFNTLHDANSQIVLSSDRPPDAVKTLEDRLRSRFKMGLVTDIQPPDFETRHAILRKKVDPSNPWVSQAALEFIAENITNNIRELEGALNRVIAWAALNQTPIEISDAEIILADVVTSRRPKVLTPRVIMDTVAAKYDFTVEDLKARDRQRPLVLARQICMYLFRELTELSYPAIAKEFGNRDHTTVIHAYDKISKQMQEKMATFDDVQSLLQELRAP
jgi:chromosomal replication initiator protein